MDEPNPGRNETENPDDAEDRLVEAVQEYQRAADAGRRPLRRDFIARYPDIADELSDCLDGMALVQSAAGALRDPGPGPGAAVAAPEPPLDPLTAQPLGDFRLIRQIGRGGMGVVYEAEQISLGRRVALKVLPLAAALDPRQLQRFRNEALAAAQLHHTNVVPVHAVGCERSVHFYAMQLIDGQSLADVIRTLRSEPDAGDGDEDASASVLATQHRRERRAFYRTVALLGAQAADGLAYAHGRGVIHRDIKPGNLLLDTAGTLWIADFGLAQLHADVAGDGLTRPGDVLGTLRYMSPEQAAGRAVLLDQRTDVYALGATLFELLTLQPAVTGTHQVAMLKEIHDGEPASARAVDPGVPAELDVILGKAMARDVADRYAGADGLAADLRRFLGDRPILARAPTLAQKLARWTRRHRRSVTVGVAVLTLVAAGLAVSTVLVARANQRVHAAYTAEQLRTREAERSSRQAREVVDLLTRFAAEELKDNPLADDARRTMLASAMDYYRDFLAVRAGGPVEDAEEIVAARQTITEILNELDAMDRLRRVGELAELLGAPAVRRELGLTAGRLEHRDLRTVFVLDLSGLAELTPPQRQARIDTVAADGRRAVEQGLSADQLRRLRQINRQLLGPRSVGEPATADRLALTRDQQKALEAVLTETRAAWQRFDPGRSQGPRPGPDPRPGRAGASSSPPDDRRDEALRIHADAHAAFLKILTPTQRTVWNELTGDPFSRHDVSPRHGTGIGPVFGGDQPHGPTPPRR